jgi:hypothetical protein
MTSELGDDDFSLKFPLLDDLQVMVNEETPNRKRTSFKINGFEKVLKQGD